MVSSELLVSEAKQGIVVNGAADLFRRRRISLWLKSLRSVMSHKPQFGHEVTPELRTIPRSRGKAISNRQKNSASEQYQRAKGKQHPEQDPLIRKNIEQLFDRTPRYPSTIAQDCPKQESRDKGEGEEE